MPVFFFVRSTSYQHSTSLARLPLQTILVSMAIGPNQAGSRPRPFWRRLVGALAIYALVMQSLLLTIAGPQLAQAAALDEISLSELCLHESDGSPITPSDQQRHLAHQHCLQCFAGASPLLDAPQAVTVASARQEFSKFRYAGQRLHLSSACRYLVARPRGPPSAA